MMIWKTAWKNVWRNKIRSLVVIISVTIGIFGGVFAVAVMNGAIEQRLDAALNEEIGHIHLNEPGFRDNLDIQRTIPDLPEVLETVRETSGISAVAPRVILTGMANTAAKSTGVEIIGIDPEKEREVFTLHESTIPGTGDFFETESKYTLAYIGQELAKELNIIRYIIDDAALKTLSDQGISTEVLEKLAPYQGERFNSEKALKKELNKILSSREEEEYGARIVNEAWSFRERSRFTLTFLDKDQYQTGAVFRIAGIYDIKNNMYESATVFVKNSELEPLTGLGPDGIHQLVLKVNDLEQTGQVTRILSEKLPELEVMHWKALQPDLAMMTDMVQQFYAVFMVVILAALAFGIVNTMLMVVLERTKELGMLTAIGMNKKRVFSMIMLESIFLSIIGGVVGMGVSSLLIAITSEKGINFSSYQEGFEALGYSAHIYPEITPFFFVLVTLLIILTGVLSSIYPALKALKMDPAEALRTE